MDVAGLALGAISLGLEVAKSIISFIDTVKGHTDDLNALESQAKALESNLEFLKQILTRLEQLPAALSTPGSTDGRTAIVQGIQSCEPNLKSLKEFVDKYTYGHHPDDPAFLSSCRDSFRRLKYGLKTEKRAELERRLTTCNTTLGLAIQAQGLDILIDHATPLRSLNENYSQLDMIATVQNQSLSSLSTDTRQVLTNQEELKTSLASQNQSISSVQSDTAQMLVNLREDQSELTNFMQIMLERTAHLDLSKSERSPALIAQRMASRPSLLRDACDAANLAVRTTNTIIDTQSASSGVTRRSGRCECLAYRRRQGWTSSIGLAYISIQTMEDADHLPHCRFYHSIFARRKSSREFATQFKIFSKALKLSLQATFDSQMGAGGWSLSRVMLHHTVVDHRTAPGFGHMAAMMRACDEFRSNARSLRVILEHGRYHVRRVFDSGIITPTAVNIYGESIVEAIFHLLYRALSRAPRQLDIIREIGREVLTFYRAPLKAAEGLSRRYSLRYHRDGTHIRALHELQSIVPSEFGGTVKSDPWLYGIVGVGEGLALDPHLAGMFNLTPLGNAIIQNATDVVSAIARCDPESVLEHADFGCRTHFHLALRTGNCVAEIWESLLTAQDDSRSTGLTTIQRLIQMDKEPCYSFVQEIFKACEYRTFALSGSDDGGDSSCRRSAALLYILQRGCAMRPNLQCSANSCPSCSSIYARQLAKRREELKRWALTVLPPADARCLSLDGVGVLDLHTEKVIQALRVHGHVVPDSLDTSSGAFETVYHNSMLSRVQAEEFLRAGFIEIHHLDSRGLCPTMIALLGWNGDHDRTWRLILLFVEHEADLKQSFDHVPEEAFLLELLPHGRTFREVSVAHLASYILGYSSAHFPEMWPSFLQWSVISKLWAARMSDANECDCVPGGSSPYFYFLTGCMRYWFGTTAASQNQRPVTEVVYFLKDLFPMVEKFIWEEDYHSILRYITFEALYLEHASSEELSTSAHSDQDEETWAALERIVSEVGNTMDEVMPEHCRKPHDEMNLERWSDGADKVVLPQVRPVLTTNASSNDDRSSSVHWTSIWLDHWVDAVDRELDSLYDMDVAAGKRTGAECLGVVWASCELAPGDGVRLDPRTDIDYWIRRLDEI